MQRNVMLKSLSHQVGRPVTVSAADLLEIVATVNYIDRIWPRPANGRAGQPWSRKLPVTIAVHEPERWAQTPLALRLCELLHWLTDDEWQLDFKPVTRELPKPAVEAPLFERVADAPFVALFSGGLDSLAGLCNDAAQGNLPVLASLVSNSRQQACQRATIAAFEREAGSCVPRISIKHHLNGVQAREASHRSRGFAYLAIAGVIAHLLEINTIRVYENGVGAINLPYFDMQHGAFATRSMHPKTLTMMAELLSMVFGSSFVIENPNQHLTKAQMCYGLPSNTWPAMRTTLSCDTAFSHRTTKVASCGICTSCLLRRQALRAADLVSVDLATENRVDVLGSVSPFDAKLENLKLMLSQAAQIQDCLRAPEPWHEMLTQFPSLLTLGNSDQLSRNGIDTARLLGMYASYVAEWQRFPSPLVSSFFDDAPAVWTTDPSQQNAPNLHHEAEMKKFEHHALQATELPQRLRSARKARGMTQMDAAQKLGLSRTTIVAIEKGERYLRPQELVDLAAIYSITVNELLQTDSRISCIQRALPDGSF